MAKVGISGNAAGGTTVAGNLKIQDGDGSTLADVLNLPNSNPVATAIVDANGDQISSFGGGTQYTEGDTDATIMGTAAMMETAGDTLEPIQGSVADGLLVNLGANNDVVVSATNLDIRDLDFASDSVDVTGSSVDVTANNLDIRDLVFATDKVDASGTTLGANSGVDVGDVTINNAAGAAAVNVQDGGNSLTVDGTVAISGSVAVTNAALSVVGGGAEATALRVTIANDSTGVLSVDDNGGSITVDGTVAATQSGTWILGANSGVDIGDVTINNASGAAAVNIQDGGNSITVDGTVAATQSGTWNINNISGTISLPTGAATSALQTQPGVDIGDVTINNAAGASAVNIQDGGNSITVDGTVAVSGTVAVTQSTSPWVISGAVTNTVLSVVGSGTEATAQRVTIATDSTGVLSIDDNGGSLTVDGTVAVTQTTSPWVTADNQTLVDNAGFTDGTSKVFPQGFIFDDVAGTALTENDVAAARIDSKRAQAHVIEDSTTRGRYTTVTAANALKVDGSAVAQPVSIAASVAVTLAAGAASIGKAEDVASVDADVGVPAMAIRKATPANTSNNDGDYEMLQMSVGRLWTSSTIDAALPAGTNAIGKLSANSGVDIGDVDVTSVVPGVGATNLGKQEDQPHTSGDTGVLFLGVRSTGTTVFTDTNGDYNPIAVSSTGQTYIGSIVPGTTATELGKAEDNAHSTGHTGVMHLGVSNLNLANDFSGTDGDYTPIAVAANGAAYAAVYRATTTLTAINITYNATTTATSAAVDCVNATMACLAFSLTESGTATDITFEIQTSDDNSTFFPYRRMPFGLLRWDDATISSYGTLSEQIEFPVIQRYVKVKVTAVGSDASNTFTVASARLSIRNGG